jgi:tRNA1Val (adenine37-N6)-methyltransferase
MPPPFRFKQFTIHQSNVVHPVGTDSVLLGAWAEVQGAGGIIDIGSGTGIIALMLAQRTQDQSPPPAIDAVEIHAKTFQQMVENIESSPWHNRVRAKHQPVQDYAQQHPAAYDLVVSNPPFFTELTVSPSADRRIGRDTATLSPHDLIVAARTLLAPNGRVALILPVREGQRMIELAALQGLYCTLETTVYTRPGKPAERLLLRLERNPYPFQRTTLVLHPPQGDERSADFEQLVGCFYL